jgi:hypothetical protein
MLILENTYVLSVMEYLYLNVRYFYWHTYNTSLFLVPETGTIPEGYAHLSSIISEDGDRIQCPKIVVK